MLNRINRMLICASGVALVVGLAIADGRCRAADPRNQGPPVEIPGPVAKSGNDGPAFAYAKRDESTIVIQDDRGGRSFDTATTA